jgi:peptidoglycan/LPS O-acetylase OafA/YrhL
LSLDFFLAAPKAWGLYCTMSEDLALGVAAPAPAAEAQIPLPGAPVSDRLEYIDGLRALAALWVLLHHARETSNPERLLKVPVLGWLIASTTYGQAAVMLFLVLSGFCLYFPYVKKNPTAPTFTIGYRKYLLRRATRIAPPCLWAALFCLPLATIPFFLVGRWREVGPVDFGAIASHVVFIHNLFPQYSAKIDYPMWSVGLEWQLYLLFPLLIWAFRKSNGLVVTGVALLVAAIIRGTYRHLPIGLGAFLHDGPFSYWEVFCAGMLAATFTVRRTFALPAWLLAGTAVLGVLGVRLGSGNGLLHDLEASVATVSVLLLAANGNGLVKRVLGYPPLVNVGIFSYSIYLVHAPLLHLAWLALRPLQLSADLTFVLLVVGSTPLIVAVSYMFHAFFERPFMRVKPAPVPTA